MPRHLTLFVFLILFLSASALAGETASTTEKKQTEVEQMESSLLQQQMQEIEKTENLAEKKSPAVQPEQKSQQVAEPARVNISYPLAIKAYGTDPLGQKLAFLLKENFNKSSFFIPAGKKEKRIILRVDTLNEFSGRPGLSSVYVFTWLFSESEETIPYFLENVIGTLRASEMEECVQKILVQTTSLMEKFDYLLQ